jgi:hypothetical protein
MTLEESVVIARYSPKSDGAFQWVNEELHFEDAMCGVVDESGSLAACQSIIRRMARDLTRQPAALMDELRRAYRQSDDVLFDRAFTALEASHTALQAKLDAVAGLVERFDAKRFEAVGQCEYAAAAAWRDAKSELAAALAE